MAFISEAREQGIKNGIKIVLIEFGIQLTERDQKIIDLSVEATLGSLEKWENLKGINKTK